MISNVNPISVNSNGANIFVTLHTIQQVGNSPAPFWILAEPPGVTYIGLTGSGVYSLYAGPPPGSTAQVVLPAMTMGQVSTITLQYQVTDISQGPFLFTAGINGNDTNLTNNQFQGTVFVTFSPPTGIAVDDTGCVCGSVASNDSPCSSCTSEWRIVLGSETNVVFDVYDPLTGTYRVHHSDPTLPISWQYDLYCINCGDGNDYFMNTATHTIPPLFVAYPSKQFIIEDIPVLPGTTNVVLSNAPLPTDDVLVFLGGAKVEQTDFAIIGPNLSLTVPASLPVNGSGTILLSVHYFI